VGENGKLAFYGAYHPLLRLSHSQDEVSEMRIYLIANSMTYLRKSLVRAPVSFVAL
jgi:hypothetical protein